MAEATTGPGTANHRGALAIPNAARISGVSVRFNEAAEAARHVLSSSWTNPVYTVMARCGLGLQSVIQGDALAAAEQNGALQMAQGILGPYYLAGDRMLGLLAQTMGELDRAVVHFEESLSFCRQAGYRPQLAWTCCDYANTYNPSVTSLGIDPLGL